jgi:uncharacterized membrane protein YgaE (UPF0421/DUF939 family)
VRTVAPSLGVAALAAGIAWFIATGIFGDRGAFFAPIAAVITTGLTAGQRLQRGIEMAVGVTLGIVVADLLVLVAGAGTLQLMGITLLAMVVAVLAGGSQLFVNQSAVSAILVVTLQPTMHGLSVARWADALIGSGVALLLNFVVFPIDPLRLLRREATPVVRELAAAIREVAAALSDRDPGAAAAALTHARSVEKAVAGLSQVLEIANQTVTAAPVRRGEREELEAYASAAAGLDLVVRDTRVLARAAMRAMDTGEEIPRELIDAIGDLADAVGGLQPWLQDPTEVSQAREAAIRAAHRATGALRQASNLSVNVIVSQVRSAAVDILRATGMPPDDARERLRATDRPEAPRQSPEGVPQQ